MIKFLKSDLNFHVKHVISEFHQNDKKNFKKQDKSNQRIDESRENNKKHCFSTKCESVNCPQGFEKCWNQITRVERKEKETESQQHLALCPTSDF